METAIDTKEVYNKIRKLAMGSTSTQILIHILGSLKVINAMEWAKLHIQLLRSHMKENLKMIRKAGNVLNITLVIAMAHIQGMLTIMKNYLHKNKIQETVNLSSQYRI